MRELRTGNALSCASSQAANLYQEAVDLILGSESGVAETLDKALELDKDFALAAVARYYVAKDTGESDAGVYREHAKQAALSATDWEREHVDVLIGLMDQSRDAQTRALDYIKTTPADLLVISQLTGAMFFYGGSQKLQKVLNVYESVENAFNDDWAYLARLGFAASEAGQHKRGRELIERALNIRPQALYSIHGLAHVLHDEGAADESAKLIQGWLKEHESGARNGQMYGHVQWHLALSEWQIGDRESAKQRYRKYCAPETTTCGPILTLADCGGFLLREYLQSGQTSALSSDVLKHIDRVWGMVGHPFIALHVAGLYVSAGDSPGLKRCEEAISATPDGVNRDVSLALVSSLRDFVAGNYQQAAQTLATISPGARIGIGGSNVERILVDLIEKSVNTLQ
jgi:tetratricopeptide (TPR) repeat protein